MTKKNRLTQLLLLLLTFTILISGCITAFAASGKWIRSGERWWFRHADYSYTSNGWEYINGEWYHFDSDGWMQTGWQRIGGKWYYLTSDGEMVTGWKKINGKWYHMDTSGAMDTDWKYVHNGWYYFGSDGERRVGLQDINGKRYYLHHENGIMQTGMVAIGAPYYIYYFDASGAMCYGLYEIDGELNYFGDDGRMISEQMQEVDGNTYYFGFNGNAMRNSFLYKNDEVYYFDENGIMAKGWKYIQEEYDEDDNWHSIYDNAWCYFNENGEMQYNRWIDGYYVNNSGIRTDKTEISFDKEIVGISICYDMIRYGGAPDYIYSQDADIISRLTECLCSSKLIENERTAEYSSEYYYFIVIHFADDDYQYFVVSEENETVCLHNEYGCTCFDIDIQPLADIWKALNA